METDLGPGCVQPDGDGPVLLAEFHTWLDRERGLSPVSVRCYSQQSKAFLAGIGGSGAVSELDAGRVTAFMVDWAQGRNTWSANAMVTSLRAFLRFAHRTGRTAAPLAGAVPAVASWQMSSLPRGRKAVEIERLLAGCDRETPVGCGTTRSCRCWPGSACGGLRPPGCSSATSTDGLARSLSRARAGPSGSRCRPRPGRRSPPRWSMGGRGASRGRCS